MRYAPKQYALALYEALKETKDEDEVIRTFAQILVKNNDRVLGPRIIRHFTRIEREKEGRHVVKLTTAQKASDSLIKEIKERVGGKTVVEEVVDPSVLGGIKLIIDDEQVIDGTLSQKIGRLFQNVETK